MPLALIVAILLALSPARPGHTNPFLLQEQTAPAPTAPESESKPAEPQTQPAAPTEQPAPDASKPAESAAPATTSPEPEKKPAPAPVKKPVKKKPSAAHKKSGTQKKTAAKPAADTGPKKVVVHNGGTADPTIQLEPAMPTQQASEQQIKTDQLLNATDANLKKMSGRQLNSSQQDAIKQVQAFMQQARTASKNGDVLGAHNLALKANLLSEDLLKH